jgi:hypothetical protein
MSGPNAFQKFARRFGVVRYAVLLDRKADRKRLSESTRAYEQSIMSNIGNYISTWAGIERMLNTFIVQYHPHADEKTRKRPLPTTLGEKISYLSTVSKDERLTLEFRQKVKGWITELGEQTEYRHMMIHGLGIKSRSYYKPIWTFQKLTLKGTSPTIDEQKYTNEEMLEALKRIGALSMSVAEVLTPILFPTTDHRSSAKRP